MAILYGIHSIEQALATRRPLERLLVARDFGHGRAQKLVEAARAVGVPVRFVQREELDRQTGTRSHQGVAAFVGAKHYAELEDLMAAARSPALFVLLDGIEDPHNLGAILRTAYCAGADGAVLPERRAAGITATVEKASAGASEHLAVARVTNLNRALEQLKKAGIWLVGLDERAQKSFTEVDLTDSVGIVLGGEGRGLHQQVRTKCDFLISIPTAGAIHSLNVSVAAGIVLYEAVRQRRVKGSKR